MILRLNFHFPEKPRALFNNSGSPTGDELWTAVADTTSFLATASLVCLQWNVSTLHLKPRCILRFAKLIPFPPFTSFSRSSVTRFRSPLPAHPSAPTHKAASFPLSLSVPCSPDLSVLHPLLPWILRRLNLQPAKTPRLPFPPSTRIPPNHSGDGGLPPETPILHLPKSSNPLYLPSIRLVVRERFLPSRPPSFPRLPLDRRGLGHGT